MKQLLTLLLVACLGACSAQKSEEHTVILTHRAMFGVSYDSASTTIDTTFFCGPEAAIFKWTPKTVTLSNERGVVEVPIQSRISAGVFVLSTEDSIPVILHIYEDKNHDYLIYFQKRNVITRFSTTSVPCDEL